MHKFFAYFARPPLLCPGLRRDRPPRPTTAPIAASSRISRARACRTPPSQRAMTDLQESTPRPPRGPLTPLQLQRHYTVTTRHRLRAVLAGEVVVEVGRVPRSTSARGAGTSETLEVTRERPSSTRAAASRHINQTPSTSCRLTVAACRTSQSFPAQPRRTSGSSLSGISGLINNSTIDGGTTTSRLLEERGARISTRSASRPSASSSQHLELLAETGAPPRRHHAFTKSAPTSSRRHLLLPAQQPLRRAQPARDAHHLRQRRDDHRGLQAQ